MARFILYSGGAGRTKAEVEFRFVDVQSDAVVMVTADRRLATRGRDGDPKSEVLLRESFDKMARDLARFLAPRKS